MEYVFALMIERLPYWKFKSVLNVFYTKFFPLKKYKLREKKNTVFYDAYFIITKLFLYCKNKSMFYNMSNMNITSVYISRTRSPCFLQKLIIKRSITVPKNPIEI